MGTAVFQDKSIYKTGQPAGHEYRARFLDLSFLEWETLQIHSNPLAVSTKPSFTSRLQGDGYKLYLALEHKLSETEASL